MKNFRLKLYLPRIALGCALAVVFLFASSYPSPARESNKEASLSQYLTFMNLARAAEDVSLINLMRSDLELVEIDRLQYIYDTDRRLLDRGGYTSIFKAKEDLVKLVEARFSQAVNASHAQIKRYEAQIWRKRAEWARNQETESPRELAVINVQWREEVLATAERGAKDMQVLNLEFDYFYRAGRTMLTRGAVSREEYVYYETLGRAGQRLVADFSHIVEQAKIALEEAKKDLAAFEQP